jgi:hypothetical protein
MLMAENHHRVRALQVVEPDPPLPAEEAGGEARTLLECLSRVRSSLDRERTEAPMLAAELLALPPETREERLRRDPRFQTWGLSELLLARSAEAAEDPAEAGRLAILALAGADGLDRARHPAPVVEDFKARAWAAAGEACLRRGDQAGAEEALRAAAGCLSHGTGDLLVEARLLEFEAYVRRDQGRPGEAAALLKMAAARYREIGDVPLLERTLAERDALLWQQPARST